jgi:hypothetical protein
VSGHGDSIRERRAREIRFGDGGRRAKTQTTKTTSLVYEVVKRFANACEQIAVLEKLCEGRLDLGYLEWNGRVDNDDIFANLR